MKERISILIITLIFLLISFAEVARAADQVGIVSVNYTVSQENPEIEDISGIQVIATDLYPGEEIHSFIIIRNPFPKDVHFKAVISEEIAPLVNLENSESDINALSSFRLNLTIKVPLDAKPGVYSGILKIMLNNRNVEIPVNIRVLPPHERLLGLEIKPLVESIDRGKDVLVYANVYNQKNIERYVNLTIQLVEIASNDVLSETHVFRRIDSTVTLVGKLHIPEDVDVGRYMIRGIIAYRGLGNRTEKVEDVDFIYVTQPLLESSLFGIPYWVLGLLSLLCILSVTVFYVKQKRRKERRRYIEMIDFSTLPRHGERLAFVGRIAEHGIRAFFEIDRLQEHTVIAGSTGAGKTIAAQDIVEECLLKGISVIVFDPTAQWTGFLRKNRDRGMLKLYKMFGMKESEARAFNGSIKIVKPPIREFDIKRYMNPGEITIFCIDKLSPEDIELLIIEVILSVFRSRMEESTKLKMLMVFDEVHRLLPKFGGSGKGIVQLERACREFRKWGIGLILISQVLSDFPKDIMANVATEIQMRTKYEGDLERIKMKYGEDIMKSVVKAKTGTGMIHNAHYNRGRPYFITFRPLLHHPRRLSDKELEMYHKYDTKIEKLKEILKKAKMRNIDVFDLEIELDLALKNLKKGSFDVVDMYLESLEPRITELTKIMESKEDENMAI